MKRLFLVLVLVVVGITWLGFSRGWFALVTGTATDGNATIGVKVDADKIKDDEAKAKEKAKQVKDKVVEKVK